MVQEDIVLFVDDILRRVGFVFAHLDDDDKRKEGVGDAFAMVTAWHDGGSDVEAFRAMSIDLSYLDYLS